MKTFTFLVCLLIFNLSFSQTKAIANKSHSGNHASLPAERDGNFGIEMPKLDSVIRISSDCIVEINNHGWRDTVCDHPYFNNPSVTLEDMKAAYPRIIFVGFEQKGRVKPVEKSKRNSERKGSLYLLAFLVAGSLMYTFVPKKRSAD